MKMHGTILGIALQGSGWILVACMLFACRTRLKDDHPEYYNRFFDQLNLNISYPEQARILDSISFAFRHFPAGVGDKANYYQARMGYYSIKNEYDTMFIYSDSLEMMIHNRINEERFREMQWNLLLTKSKSYQTLKNYDAAMMYLMRARTLRPPNDKRAEYALDSRTAGMLYQQGRFLLAAQYYLKMYEDAPSCHTGELLFMTRQGDLDNAGLCYAQVDMLDSAMFYYNATLNYLNLFEREIPEKKNFIKLARGIVYGNIANVKARQHDFETAEALSLASIKATETDDPNFTLTTRLNLANTYISWGKPDKAQAMLHAMDSLSAFRGQSGTLEEKRMEWNLAMKKQWEGRGDLSKAYIYNDRYLHIRDSLDAIRKKDVSRDIGQEFENMEQRALNDKLEVANREKSFQFVIAMLAAVLAAAVGLFVWYNLRRSSKHVKELKRLNAQVQEKNDDLMQAFSSLEESHAENSRMTRMVAHDLKNPIGGIRTLVYTLMSKTVSEDLKKMLELIYTTCTSSINTINDLLKEKGSLVAVKKEMVDLRRLMEYCVDLLQTKSEEKKQEFHFVSGEDIFIYANREKMWRVMSNLLTNAIKFSPEYSVIDIKLEKKPTTAILSVKDQGIGIPESLREKIFTGAAEISRAGTAGEESHGLGLSITQQIVAEHHGKIWFESEENKGCTFYVELPLN